MIAACTYEFEVTNTLPALNTDELDMTKPLTKYIKDGEKKTSF